MESTPTNRRMNKNKLAVRKRIPLPFVLCRFRIQLANRTLEYSASVRSFRLCPFRKVHFASDARFSGNTHIYVHYLLLAAVEIKESLHFTVASPLLYFRRMSSAFRRLVSPENALKRRFNGCMKT